jgi:hypothetical protein
MSTWSRLFQYHLNDDQRRLASSSLIVIVIWSKKGCQHTQTTRVGSVCWFPRRASKTFLPACRLQCSVPSTTNVCFSHTVPGAKFINSGARIISAALFEDVLAQVIQCFFQTALSFTANRPTKTKFVTSSSFQWTSYISLDHVQCYKGDKFFFMKNICTRLGCVKILHARQFGGVM